MKSIFATKEHVKIFGRTLQEKDCLWLIHSASGIEFSVSTSELSFTLLGDCTSRTSRGQDGSLNMNLARYAIYVDGKRTITGSMDEEEKTVTVFSGSQKKNAVITFIKLTESSQSYMAIKTVNASDDAVLVPTKEKPFKIEFIGDSITCGYGVEGKSASELFTTQTEDATKAYAYLTAKALDADWSIVGFSGFGVVSGWTDTGDHNPVQLVPDYYEKFCFSWNTDMFKERLWNFSLFRPQLVVTNLGTNDDSYTRDDSSKQEEYVSHYVDFIKQVRSHNPESHILLALGIMTGGQRLVPFMHKAAQSYSVQTGDKNISTYAFAAQTAQEGFGADSHPSEATQMRCAKEFTAHIRKLIADGRVVTSQTDSIPLRELAQKALDMLSYSYSPYSNYTVGAALLADDGKIFTGCNIENVAFGPSNCAERTAFFKAVSEGRRNFKAIAIAGGPNGKPVDYCTPCGVCRQVMVEFCSRDFLVIMAKTADDFKIKTLEELLPESFKPEEQVGQSSVR